jgi:hypothetical protein
VWLATGRMGALSGWGSRVGAAEWLGVYGRGLNVSSAGTKKLRSGAEKRRRLRGREGDMVDVDAEKEAEGASGGRASGMGNTKDRGVSGG